MGAKEALGWIALAFLIALLMRLILGGIS